MAITEPLRALRVIDTTDGWGELCGRLLGDLGADVVRVEPPEGSRSRRLAPRHDEVGLFHAYRNVGKRPLSLDLATDAGRRHIDAMFIGADVWIESSKPAAPPPGLDPTDVLSRHPHLVITSITPFGRTGPYRLWEATDSVIEALSGMMFKAGIPSKPPLIPPSQIANDIASTTAAFATLAARWQAATTGHGQHIDLSVMAATAQTTDWSMSSASVSRARGLPYNEVRNGSGPVYSIYACKDGYVRMVVLSRRQWHSMRDWLGEPDYLQDERYDTFVGRMEIIELLQHLYTDHFSTMTRDEVSVEAQRRGIACTPVLTPRGRSRQRSPPRPRHLHGPRSGRGDDRTGGGRILRVRWRAPAPPTRTRDRCRLVPAAGAGRSPTPTLIAFLGVAGPRLRHRRSRG